MFLDKEEQARVDVWKYAFGYIDNRVVKSAIELEIPDILANHGCPISLSDLSSALACPPESLRRIMRFLIHQGIFKKAETPNDGVYYAATPLSHLMTRSNLGPFMLLQATPPGPDGGVSPEGLRAGKLPDFPAVDDEYTKLLREALACQAKVATTALIDHYPEGLKGIGSLVEVGDHCRGGSAVSLLVKAFPWVRGLSFDLPETVGQGPTRLDDLPKADAVLLMWILHEFSDEVCIDILKKCKEAIPKETGKVIIVEAIFDEEGGEGDEFTGARLSLDMVTMAVTAKGKERTYKEWAHLLAAAGFSRKNVKSIKSVVSVIEAFP